MNIGITLTSSLEVGQEYIDLTEHIARELAQKKYGVVYGGTAYGMMLKLAESYKQNGGTNLVGVMARDLMAVTKGYEKFSGLDQEFLMDTMEERKGKIAECSDAFLILPGGYGTLEEIGTFLGGRVNKLFDKPIAFYNANGFYDDLFAFFAHMYDGKFSKIPWQDVIFASDDLEAILTYFERYQQKELADKFIRDGR